MINIAEIYVRTTVSLLQQIHICCYRENIKYYMLAHPDFNNISIDTYKQEILSTFLLANGVYITCSLNQVYV